MNRAGIFAALIGAGIAGVALAGEPPADKQVPPPPQTQGQLNSMAAKEPAQPEKMKPLSKAAQATPGKKPPEQAANDKAKPAAEEQKPKDR
jgi:hypothetical protein